MRTRREAFILVSRPPNDAAKVVLPSPGVADVTAMMRAGRSRLLRVIAVNTDRSASATEEVVRSSTFPTAEARRPLGPLIKGIMPSTAKPVAFSTWAAARKPRSSFSAPIAPPMPSRQPITKAANKDA